MIYLYGFDENNCNISLAIITQKHAICSLFFAKLTKK